MYPARTYRYPARGAGGSGRAGRHKMHRRPAVELDALEQRPRRATRGLSSNSIKCSHCYSSLVPCSCPIDMRG